MTDKFQELLEDYHAHKHDPIEDSYLNITCENSKEKRKNCTCRKCEIRKKKASGTRKSIHIKEENETDKKDYKLVNKDGISPKVFKEINKLATQKLVHTPFEIYSDEKIKSESIENNLQKWESSGLKDSFINEFINSLYNDGQIDYAFERAQIANKEDTPLEIWYKIIQSKFNHFLSKNKTNKVFSNLERRLVKILSKDPYEKDPNAKLAYRLIGDRNPFREPTKEEINNAIEEAGNIQQEQYNPESSTAWRVYSASNLELVAELLISSLPTSLPKNHILGILEKLCPLDKKDSIDSIYEDISAERDGSRTKEEIIPEQGLTDNIEIISEELEQKGYEIYIEIIEEIQETMKRTINNLDKRKESGLQVILSIVNWMIGENAIEQKDFAEEIGIHVNSLKNYKKDIKEILGSYLEKYEREESVGLTRAMLMFGLDPKNQMKLIEERQ